MVVGVGGTAIMGVAWGVEWRRDDISIIGGIHNAKHDYSKPCRENDISMLGRIMIDDWGGGVGWWCVADRWGGGGGVGWRGGAQVWGESGGLTP